MMSFEWSWPEPPWEWPEWSCSSSQWPGIFLGVCLILGVAEALVD